MTNPGTSPAEEQPKVPSGTFMPLVSLRKYWHYGLAAALVVACLGSIVAFSKRDKFTYSVMAKVRIAPRFSTVLTEQKEVDFDSMQKWRLFQEQQAIKVKQYDVVLEALKTLNMGRTKEGKPLIWLQKDDKKHINEDIEVDETPLQEEVDRLTKQWRRDLHQEEIKRREALRGQGGTAPRWRKVKTNPLRPGTGTNSTSRSNNRRSLMISKRQKGVCRKPRLKMKSVCAARRKVWRMRLWRPPSRTVI